MTIPNFKKKPLDWSEEVNKPVEFIDIHIGRNIIIAEAKSKTDKEVSSYMVYLQGDCGYCTCKDFSINREGKTPCKHLWELRRKTKR